MSSLPLRSEISPPFQASKWIKLQVLIDENEMKQLLSSLGNFWIVQTSGMIRKGEEIISHENFLNIYHDYVVKLKTGALEVDSKMRSYFSSAFTSSLDALYASPIKEHFYLVKVQQPVIQLQMHRFDYSTMSESFHSMIMSNDSVHWGLQFGYPHLYQDVDHKVYSVKDEAMFPNNSLFKNLQYWVRHHTIATPFQVNDKRVNVSFRLGKECSTWINDHPQLKSRGLIVCT